MVEIDGKKTVIAGDAAKEEFVREQDKYKEYLAKPDVKQSMIKVFEIADEIIPGHGPVIKGENLKELKQIVDQWR